ncbi:hypothetical protein AVEN_27643-1 [Araneus ventricosus]|uniref:Uncharacterized protein n=1 Tax=Araneus ventricosus TaxID=182803 RepID=A0A4Y2PFQ9_ARAVE|nr:hypothetical protein AVEN_27643-1 [Araneus ventricosus]
MFPRVQWEAVDTASPHPIAVCNELQDFKDEGRNKKNKKFLGISILDTSPQDTRARQTKVTKGSDRNPIIIPNPSLFHKHGSPEVF